MPIKDAPATLGEYKEFKRSEQKRWRRANLFFAVVFIATIICLLGTTVYKGLW